MSGLTKGFEKYFPLPWKAQCRGTWEHINAENGKGCNICIIPATDYEPKKAARQYLVQCANLMPECVNMLKEADTYMTSMLVGLCNDCPDKGTEMCRVCKLKTVLDDIETLLAKLEGGADDAQNP